MLGKAASEANQILDKVDNFKYFALLGTFVMMLDSTLIYINNVSLLTMSWDDITSKITIGKALVFICFFSLYITFIVTAIKFIISGIALSLPSRVSMYLNSTSENQRSRREYINIRRLESMAIRKNNSTAYDAVKAKRQEMESSIQLERYCLAFLVSSIVNYIASSDEVESVVSILAFISDINSPTYLETIKMVFGALLYFGMFRIGVLIGCGFIYDTSDRDYIYLPKEDELS